MSDTFNPADLVDDEPSTNEPALPQPRTYTQGPATVFGLNLDGSRDKMDNGVGAWGTPTANTDIVGVSLPIKVVRDRFGKGNAAHGRLVEVINPATGATIVAPIVDKGPAEWTGNVLDLTHRAAKMLGSTGKDTMQYRILDDEEHGRVSQQLPGLMQDGTPLTVASARALAPNVTYFETPSDFDPANLVDENEGLDPSSLVDEDEWQRMKGLEDAGRLDLSRGIAPTMELSQPEPLPGAGEAPQTRFPSALNAARDAQLVAPLVQRMDGIAEAKGAFDSLTDEESKLALAQGIDGATMEVSQMRDQLRLSGLPDDDIERRIADFRGLTPQTAARLSDGTVTVNPSLVFDGEAWEKAARSTGASEAEIQRALEARTAMREDLAPELDAIASRSSAYMNFLRTSAQKLGYGDDTSKLYDIATPGDLLEQFYQQTGTGLGNLGAQTSLSMQGAFSGIGQGVLGAADMLTPDAIDPIGLGALADEARRQGNEVARIRNAIGGGWWAQRLANVAGAAVSTLPAMMGLPAGLSGMAVAGGVMQAGQTYNDALAAGYSTPAAFGLGIGSGAVEAGLTKAFGATGFEALAGERSAAGAGRRFIKGALEELPEELTQQAAQIPFQSATNPDYQPTAEEFLDVGLASMAMGGSMGLLNKQPAPQMPAPTVPQTDSTGRAAVNSVDLSAFSNPVTDAGQSTVPDGVQTTANATPQAEPMAESGAAPAPAALSIDELAQKHGIAPELAPMVRDGDWQTLERRQPGTPSHASALEFVTRTATARAQAAATPTATSPTTTESATQPDAPTEQPVSSTGQTSDMATESASVQPAPVTAPEQSASQLSEAARNETIASINAQLGKLSPEDRAASAAAQAEYEAELKGQLEDYQQSNGRPLDVAVRLLGGLPMPESASAGPYKGELANAQAALLEARRDKVRGEKTKAAVMGEIFGENADPDALINGLREQGFDVQALADVTEMLADGYRQGRHWIGTGFDLNAEGGPDVPFSQQKEDAESKASPGMVRDMQGRVDKIARKLGGKGMRVQVVQNRGQLPSAIVRQHGLRSGNLIEAYVAPDGSIAMNLDAIARVATKRGQSVEKRVKQLLLHEIVGHLGISALFAGRIADWHAQTERLFERLKRSKFSEADTQRFGYGSLDELATLYGFDKATVEGRAALIEEHLARVAESGVRPAWWQAVISRLRDALRRLGFEVKGDDEVEQLLSRARKAAKTAPATSARMAQQEAMNELRTGIHSVNTSRGRAMLVPPLSMQAYHGTPHTVDKFSTEKIGTGEGAQVYGWGLYFAENKTTATYYRETLSRKAGAYVDGNPAKTYGQVIWEAADDIAALGGDVDAYIEQQKLRRNAAIDTASKAGNLKRVEILKEILSDDLEAAEFLRAKKITRDGNLYTVELLPDETDFLDWDKPLSEQSEKIQRIAAEELKRIGGGASTGERFYKELVFQHRSEANAKHPEWMQGEKIPDEMAASRRLLELGVRGIRYFDGASRAAGAGSRNYVIFDEDDIRITHKNGEPIDSQTAGKTPETAPRFSQQNPVVKESLSVEPTPEKRDADYLAAVKRGDMETAQRMVDAAAKAAGYDVGPVYHGTRHEFNAFVPMQPRGAVGNPEGIYFSPDRLTAEEYSMDAEGATDKRSRVIAAYLKNTHHKVSRLYGTTEYWVTNPENAKSADPITYDEAGNVIPLSKRFNQSTPDIRFSQQVPTIKESLSVEPTPEDRAIERALLADAKDLQEHGLTRRMRDLPDAPDAVQTMAKGLYATFTDKAAIADAQQWLAARTEEQAITELRALEQGQADKTTFTAAQLLIERLHARGESATAGLISQRMATIATTFGQAIQSLHMMLNLADEAALLSFAQKEFDSAATKKLTTPEGKEAAQDLQEIQGKMGTAAATQATDTLTGVSGELDGAAVETKAEMESELAGLAATAGGELSNEERAKLQDRIDDLDFRLRALQQSSKHALGKTQAELEAVRKKLEEARKALQLETGRGTAKHLAQALAILKTAQGLTEERKAELMGKMRSALMSDDGTTATIDRLKGILIAAGMKQAKAAALAKRIVEGYRARARKVRDSLLRQLAEGAAPRITSRLKKGDVSKWLVMNEQGMLDDSTLFSGIAKRWGFPMFTAKDAATAKEFVRRYNSTTSETVKLAIGAEMMDWLHSHTSPATRLDKASAMYRLTKLMSFKTLFRIVIGNLGAAALQTVAIDVPRYGLSTLGVAFGRKYQPLQTAIGAMVDGTKQAMQIFREGRVFAESEGRSGVAGGLQTLLAAAKAHTGGIRDAGELKKMASTVFSGRALKGFETFMHVMLTLPDYPRFLGEVKQSLARQMAREGNEVPTAEQYEEAYLQGQRSVWLNREKAAKIAGQMVNLFNLNQKFGLGTVIMPFTTVPTNLLVEGSKWTPMGFVQAIYEARRDRGEDQRSAVNTLLKAAAGTAAIGKLGAYLFALGILTGGEDDDRDIQKHRELTGWQRYSVNVSELKRRTLSGDWFSPSKEWQDGDAIESFAFLQPVAMALAAGAERERLTQKYSTDKAAGKAVGEEGWWTSIAQPIGGAFKSFADQPMVTGISIVGDDLKRMFDEGDPAQMLALFTRALDFVPAFVRDIRYGMNDSLAETRDSNAIKAELYRIVGGIPGNTLAQRYDTLGRAQHKYDAARSGWLNALLNPLTERIVRRDPLADEALRLWSTTGSKAVIPDTVKKQVEIQTSPDPRSRRTIPLTAAQISEHQRLAGQLTALAMRDLMAHPAYTRWPDAVRAKFMGEQIGAASAAAKHLLYGDSIFRFTPGGMQVNKAAAAAIMRAKASGIVPQK